MAVWLSAPQAVGYVADDGSVFLKRSESWVELTDWRGDNGLNPLIIGDVIDKSPCAGKGAACWLDVVAGQAEIAPGIAVEVGAAGACASRASLTLRPVKGEAMEVDPCAFAGKGGAVIDATADGLRLVPAQRQETRFWTQPLYAPVPKAPKSRSAPSQDPPAAPAAPSVTLRVPPPPPSAREESAPANTEVPQ